MFFTDRAGVSGTRRTRDGYLVADVRIARTGIQNYSGAEVGRPAMAQVRVYRSPETVFSPDAMASAAHKAVTTEHPTGMVDAARWKELASGWTGDAVARDGDFLRVPMMVADQGAIAGIESGAREVSCGYSCELDWTSGSTPAGEQYDAVQRDIVINHVAIVPRGRAGSECRIGDSLSLDDAAFLFDAAGNPGCLVDEATGQRVKLNADLIEAIKTEAGRLGMPLKRYIAEVLNYAEAHDLLSGKVTT